PLIQNFDRDLSAMRMSRQEEIIALFNSHREDVGIVGQQNVAGAGHDELLRASQILLLACRRLVVDTRQVERGIAETKRRRLVAEEADAGAQSGSGKVLLHAGIAFV